MRKPSLDLHLLFLDQMESFVGCAQLRSVFIAYDRDGNIFQEIFEMPFVFERAKEIAIFHFFKDFDGDAAGYVDAAQCENFEREITGFRAVNVGPKIDCLDADWAGFIETVHGNFRSGVGVRIGEGWMLDGGIQKFVNSAKPAAGQN